MFRARVWMVLCLVFVTLPAAAQTLANEPVAQLDLNHYLGSWHEIAHLPLYFQRQCVDNITATYTPPKDGLIGVHNACRTKDGTTDTADGAARSNRDRPGALEVRFAPSWLGWVPFVWADYWVVELDPDYQWAVVGSPSKKYMWVLSRTPTMNRALFEKLRKHAAERGYAVDKLIIAGKLD